MQRKESHRGASLADQVGFQTQFFISFPGPHGPILHAKGVVAYITIGVDAF